MEEARRQLLHTRRKQKKIKSGVLQMISLRNASVGMASKCVASLKPEDRNVLSRIFFFRNCREEEKINVIGMVNNDITTDKGAVKSSSL
jgi:hypothetical protein